MKRLVSRIRGRNRHACEYGGCADLRSPIPSCGPTCHHCSKCGCCHACHPLMSF